MNITQLSDNGFFATEILPDELLNELIAMAKSFETVDDIRGNGTLTCKREVSFLFKNTEINNQIIGILEPHIKPITPNYSLMYGLELWRDYPGYTNPTHILHNGSTVHAQSIQKSNRKKHTHIIHTSYTTHTLILKQFCINISGILHTSYRHHTSIIQELVGNIA
jgi:hypothetical protein